MYAAARSLRGSMLAHHFPVPGVARIALAIALACTLAAGHGKAAEPAACQAAACLYRDASQAPEVRARDLVSRMTLEEKAAQMQDAAPAIERLGLKRYGWWNEVLHGVARAGNATVFPQAIGLAATWDTALMEQIGDAIAVEGRANFNAALRGLSRRQASPWSSST